MKTLYQMIVVGALTMLLAVVDAQAMKGGIELKNINGKNHISTFNRGKALMDELYIRNIERHKAM